MTPELACFLSALLAFATFMVAGNLFLRLPLFTVPYLSSFLQATGQDGPAILVQGLVVLVMAAVVAVTSTGVYCIIAFALPSSSVDRQEDAKRKKRQ